MKPDNRPVQIVVTKYGVMMFKITTMTATKTIDTDYISVPIGTKTIPIDLLEMLGQQMLKLKIAR